MTILEAIQRRAQVLASRLPYPKATTANEIEATLIEAYDNIAATLDESHADFEPIVRIALVRAFNDYRLRYYVAHVELLAVCDRALNEYLRRDAA